MKWSIESKTFFMLEFFHEVKIISRCLPYVLSADMHSCIRLMKWGRSPNYCNYYHISFHAECSRPIGSFPIKYYGIKVTE